jgi:16S rRNA (guanine527-N7)-methyltransferase
MMETDQSRLAVLRSMLESRYSELTCSQIDQFTKYYELVLKWNGRLHLTTLTEPKDFLERHIAEVLSVIGLIEEQVAVLWDLGAGLGVPGIPLKILRPDLEVKLVESSRKKAIFLETVIAELGLLSCRVDCRRIENLPPPTRDVLLTARAIEQMERLIPLIRHLAATAGQSIIFISRDLGERIPGSRLYPIPHTDHRCLAILECST